MKKLSKNEMKKVKGGIAPCQAIIWCNCNGVKKEETVNCVYVGGGWDAGCNDDCAWVSTVVDYCNLCS
jgi:bacteriocin-like protein